MIFDDSFEHEAETSEIHIEGQGRGRASLEHFRCVIMRAPREWCCARLSCDAAETSDKNRHGIE